MTSLGNARPQKLLERVIEMVGRRIFYSYESMFLFINILNTNLTSLTL